MPDKMRAWGRLLPAHWRAGAGALSAQWLSVVFVAAVSLALSVWLARCMEPSGFGRYAYLLNLATLLALVQDAGLRTLVMRERVAPSPSLARFSAVLPGMARGHLLLATAAMACGSLLLSVAGADPALAWAVLCFAAVTLAQLVAVQLKAAGQWFREALWQAAGRVLSALAIAAAVWLLGASPSVVFGAWAGALLLAYALSRGDWHDRPCWPRWPVYRAAAGFLWIDLATSLYRRSDIVLLHWWVSPEDVGQYAVAARLFDGILLLASPLALFFFRRLRLARPDAAAARRLYARTLLAAVALGAGLAATGMLLGPWLVGLLYGDAYRAEGGALVGWLFLAFVIVLPNYVLTQAAIAMDRERCYAVGATLAAVTNLVLNFLIVPDHGVRGAAAVVIATEAVLGGVLYFGLRRAWRPAVS